jgi:hypothetical protein
MTGLAILVLVICVLIFIGVFAWLAFYDLEAFLQTLGALALVIVFSGALTWSLVELGLMK